MKEDIKIEKINVKLYDEIFSGKMDFSRIQQLLSLGANPLGLYCEHDGSILGKVFACLNNDNLTDLKENVLDLLNLFIQNGLNISDLKYYSFNNDTQTGEMYSFFWGVSPLSINVLKLLLGNGLTSKSFEGFLDHYCDSINLSDNCVISEKRINDLINIHKVIMLAASYPEIINSSSRLRNFIEIDNKYNVYDLKNFSKVDDYYYEFDLSTCDSFMYGIENATVNIYDKNNRELVWIMHL